MSYEFSAVGPLFRRRGYRVYRVVLRTRDGGAGYSVENQFYTQYPDVATHHFDSANVFDAAEFPEAVRAFSARLRVQARSPGLIEVVPRPWDLDMLACGPLFNKTGGATRAVLRILAPGHVVATQFFPGFPELCDSDVRDVRYYQEGRFEQALEAFADMVDTIIAQDGV